MHPDASTPMNGCVLFDSEMRANRIVVIRVGRQDAAQMRGVEYDDMVEAFPADRADHAFHVSILPG